MIWTLSRSHFRPVRRCGGGGGVKRKDCQLFFKVDNVTGAIHHSSQQMGNSCGSFDKLLSRNGALKSSAEPFPNRLLSAPHASKCSVYTSQDNSAFLPHFGVFQVSSTHEFATAASAKRAAGQGEVSTGKGWVGPHLQTNASNPCPQAQSSHNR